MGSTCVSMFCHELMLVVLTNLLERTKGREITGQKAELLAREEL